MFGRVDFWEEGKKKGEKMRRKFFLEGVWLGGGEGKEMVGPGVFSWAHQKVFFSKWGEN